MLAVCTVMEFCECGDLAEHRKMLSGKSFFRSQFCDFGWSSCSALLNTSIP